LWIAVEQVAIMGFLNLASWRSAGGRIRAERSSGMVQIPPARYYYDQLPTFQSMVDSYCEVNGRRPGSLDDLYLWVLASEENAADEGRAADLADWLSYFEVEPNSLLGIVNVVADRTPIARRLLDARDAAGAGGLR
jgi:hypothetical protein